MATQELNNFSPKLRALADKHAPRDEFVTFRLLQAATTLDAADSRTRAITLERMPCSRRMTRYESITDFGTGRTVILANFIRHVPGENGTMRDVIGEVVFLDGELNVPRHDTVLYERMLLSNYNKDNPNPSAREPEFGYWYEVVKPAANAKTKLAQVLAVSRAMSAVAELSDSAVLRAIEKLNLPTIERGRKLSAEELMLSLTTVAQAEPERVESVLESGEAKTEQLIAKAVELGILDFVAEASQWRYKATQEPICEAVQGYKPEEALVMYIQKNANGPAFSQALVKRVAQEKK